MFSLDAARLGLALTFVLALPSCFLVDEDEERGIAADGTPAATADEIKDCRRSCDQLQFFDCVDASAHASCHNQCSGASARAIGAFTSCMSGGGVSCRTECLSNISNASSPGAGLDPASIQAVSGCKEGCERMSLFSCLSAQERTSCERSCEQVGTQLAASFASCASGARTCERACYAGLDPAFSGADVPGCRDACDKQAFYDCIDSTEQSTCRALCESADDAAVEDFKACTKGICRADDGCYALFSSR